MLSASLTRAGTIRECDGTSKISSLTEARTKLPVIRVRRAPSGLCGETYNDGLVQSARKMMEYVPHLGRKWTKGSRYHPLICEAPKANSKTTQHDETKGLCRILPSLGVHIYRSYLYRAHKVCKHEPHWIIWSPIGLNRARF